MTTTTPTVPSRWARFRDSYLLYSFKRDMIAQVCLLIFVTMVVAAALAPWLAPMNPYDLAQIDILSSELPPFWIEGSDPQYLLGTDAQGRDLLSTILYGARVSLIIGFGAVILQALIGVSFGLLAGYLGGRVDAFLMRLADIQLSFSTLMVAIIVGAVFKATFGGETFSEYAVLLLVLIIGLAEWPQYARTVRASVLAERSKEYVDAARVMGFRAKRIMFRHILPNTLSPIFVISTVQVANAIISEAALSFLGLGMPETQPSLGSLIKSGFDYIQSGSWWITLIPGMVLVVLVLVINLLGDWLRDVMNPRLYKG
ncbi:ABC transporter permease [Halomonas sp. McH1-25]|uniref:ABC transporter permease n=1 Tax=unclassified Halomonas TaxID=2609666 RepID=UPI001EF4F29C|nr:MULTISPECIES: ABC transporter permease [unclassified Halomonas]MCG7598475.1 ABC transporter permease [Halomonas sp. McH1-25]MCP1343444.1 ABC transporter permease [Halomonas sp. FL8]MCP1361358.1 ABC transporter permease [Halomonas sp. BBD45]MCP1364946.1 ABC transporter permease [Halomonas sp. BBD48]